MGKRAARSKNTASMHTRDWPWVTTLVSNTSVAEFMSSYIIVGTSDRQPKGLPQAWPGPDPNFIEVFDEAAVRTAYGPLWLGGCSKTRL